MITLRAAIYARHSTDKQNPASSEDQIAACYALAKQIGAEVVGTYADPEISGYRRDRPGLLRLLSDISSSRIDVVLCEALDRIARDGEDISWIGKKLSYHRVRLFTQTEREIDDVKLAVAGLLGSMFLTNLRTKTFRGMKAAVLAGRLAGGKAYGYRKVVRTDADGRSIAGVFEIDPEQADVVKRIYREFAGGRSSIQIAAGLNAEKIPGPRGGEWNGSTIRGDPKKLVGILNNPLYVGKLVWGRREWRKNPDSDKRERRYRMRDRAEWIQVDLPDLRVIDADTQAAVLSELKRRKQPNLANPSISVRARHLFSGMIKCAECGSNYTVSGKDYYRCARNRERGTCSNRTSVRITTIENTVLSALQSRLLTPDLVRLFTDEFAKEVKRLTRTREESQIAARARLAALEVEITNLAQHFLRGAVSPTLSQMLDDRETEKEAILLELQTNPAQDHDVVPHPVLVRRYEEKIGQLRDALNDPAVRPGAIQILRELIGDIVIHPEANGETVVDVEAPTTALIDFAQNEKKPLRRSRGACSIAVVAGVGFEPTTFRL